MKLGILMVKEIIFLLDEEELEEIGQKQQEKDG